VNFGEATARSQYYLHIHLVFVTFVVRLLLAKETKGREEVEKRKQELEEQLNRYSTQFETTQQGSHLSAM